MKTISTIILIILVGCKAPRIKNQVRRIWSTHFNVCTCQWYNPNEVEPIAKPVLCEDFFLANFPDLPTLDNPQYCDDLVGFNGETWAKKLTPWGKELKSWAKDTCK
jgi:hypothetical protein